MRGISVVIPNYNGIRLLPEILPPLIIALENSGLTHEIIIADDFSSDDSVNWVKMNYPDVILIGNDSNMGFSPTINKGIFRAKYSMLLLLNSDVKVSENYFLSLIDYMNDDDCFGVMGKIIGWNDDKVQDGGKYPSYHGVKIKTSGNYLPLERDPGQKFLSMYLSGANAFVDRAKLLKLGGFDELFAPFYVEDFELSLRAWRMGWKLYFEPLAVCRHQESVSIKSRSKKSFVKGIYYRNKMFLHAIHLPKNKMFLWYLQLIPETFIRLVTGRFYYVRSLRMFFGNMRGVTQSRKKLERTGNGKLLEVKEVTDMIRGSLANVKIKKF